MKVLIVGSGGREHAIAASVAKSGRVLGITAKGADLKEARANAYAAAEWISFENKYMRHDIGKAIEELT